MLTVCVRNSDASAALNRRGRDCRGESVSACRAFGTLRTLRAVSACRAFGTLRAIFAGGTLRTFGTGGTLRTLLPSGRLARVYAVDVPVAVVANGDVESAAASAAVLQNVDDFVIQPDNLLRLRQTKGELLRNLDRHLFQIA